MTRLRALAALCCLWLSVAAHAELQQFCQVEKVDVQKLGNAIVIKLNCDGLVDFSPDWMTMWGVSADGSWSLQSTTRFSLLLDNVICGSASMVNVAQYPVSHLEFQLQPGARQNIGIRCTVVLYRPGYVTVFSAKEPAWDQTRAFRYRTQTPRVTITRSTDQKQIIITVLSNRPEEPETVRPPVVEAAPALEVSGTAESLNLRALHTSLQEVVEALATRVGQPVFVDEGVQAKVTAQFTGRPARQALQGLAAAYGLCLREDAGAFYLTRSRPDTPASYWASVSETVPLKYLAPGDALLLLPEVVMPYVHTSPDGNALVVDGPPCMVTRIVRDLMTLDQPSRHCRLRAWVVSAEASAHEVTKVLARGAGRDSLTQADSSGELSLTVGPPQVPETLASLRALAERRELELEALPEITCLTGQNARLFIGQQIYYLRMYGWYAEVRLGKVGVGSELTIQPRNVGDEITARVDVRNSFAGAATDAGPTIFTRSAGATLRMRSGDLIVVGGLRAGDATNHRDEPLPWLDPLSEALSGRLKSRTKGEVTILVQAESLLTPPRAKPEEVNP